jgi:hypothetical protein
MTDAELWAAWRLWMFVAGAVIVVAAALLVAIWLTARSIRAHALRALAAAEQIRRHTLPIWELQTSNEVALELLDTVQRIEKLGGALAEALESHAGAGGGGRR